MAIPRKQIGWSQESNLLWEISRQMEKLTGVAANSGGGGVTSIIAGDGINVDVPTGNVTVSLPYRSYVCLITWDGGSSFTMLTELQNDGFNITLSQQATGLFVLEDTSGPFLQSKTFVNIQQDNNTGNGNNGVVNNYIYRSADDQIKIQVYDIDAVTSTETLVDLLTYVSVEIRVYP